MFRQEGLQVGVLLLRWIFYQVNHVLLHVRRLGGVRWRDSGLLTCSLCLARWLGALVSLGRCELGFLLGGRRNKARSHLIVFIDRDEGRLFSTDGRGLLRVEGVV